MSDDFMLEAQSLLLVFCLLELFLEKLFVKSSKSPLKDRF